MSLAAAAPAAVAVREIPAGASLDGFIELAWRINAADPCWVPPLRIALKSVLDRRRHPFHRHAEVAYFVARRGGEDAGRIAAIVNHRHNEFHADRLGFFGFFEAVDDEAVARALVDAAADWLRARGMDRMRGPFNFSTNDEAGSPGVLVDGFDTPPYVMMSHGPRYYGGLLEAAGLLPAKDLLAYRLDDPNPPERLARGVDRLIARSGVRIRTLEMRRLRQEVATIQEVYNAAWSLNWGFVPMTDAEFEYIARDLRPILDPNLCLVAEVDGEAVGFSLALPDLNRALRHLPDGRLFPFGLFRLLWHKRRIDQARVLTLGFKPGYQHLGIGAAFYLRTFQIGVARGYIRGEASWILDDNLDMRHALEKMGAHVYKRYRVFERSL